MYAIVSLVGSVIRQICLPNPFANLFSNEGIAILFNLGIGFTVISFLSYCLVGCVYESGEAPAVGSMLYTFFYILITFTFYWLTLLIKNVIVACILYLFLYLLVCILLSRLKDSYL